MDPLKIYIPTQTHNLYTELGPKRCWGRRDPIIESMGWWGATVHNERLFFIKG